MTTQILSILNPVSKTCTICNESKPVSEFHKNNKSKDGLQCACKVCYCKRKKDFYRSKKGLVLQMHKTQCNSSRRRGHQKPEYTAIELVAWCLSNPIYHELHDKWVASNYDKMLVPSIDRISDTTHYYFGNIQLMSWQDNKNKAEKDIRKGLLSTKTKPHKPVLGTNMSTWEVSHFVSISQASRATGVGRKEISRVTKNKQKSAGGYLWSCQ